MQPPHSACVRTDFDPATGEIFEKMVCPRYIGYVYQPGSPCVRLMCKARTCPTCARLWSYKWRKALKEKAEYDTAMGLPAAKLALTLTFRENADYQIVRATLRYFWQSVRKTFPKVQYWGVVEFNQAHTLPHLHFILSGYNFIDHEFLREAWQLAQKWAGITKIAYILRVEEIKSNIQAYFTKYITKVAGGKDEIPRKEEWSGRYIRYSRHFFPATIPTMRVYQQWLKSWENDDFGSRSYFYLLSRDHAKQSLSAWESDINASDREIDDLVQAVWQPWVDKRRAEFYEKLDKQARMF